MIDIVDLLFDNPCIMAIKDNTDLKECIKDDYKNNKIVFVLYGNIENITNIVEKLKDHDKIVFVHENLIEGLSCSHFSPSFIKKYTDADGIITLRAQNAYEARKIGLCTVFRFFLLDSLSYESVKDTVKTISSDLLEVLPGIMPKMIGEISRRYPTPLVAGGLIRDKSDVVDALNAGAIAVSSSNYAVWKM